MEQIRPQAGVCAHGRNRQGFLKLLFKAANECRVVAGMVVDDILY